MKRFAAFSLALAALASPAGAAVVISSGATSNMNCSVGTCTPTAKNAVLNVSQLQGLLASGDVTVNTGSGAVTIGITSPLTWASTSRLTLNAAQGVAIKAAVVVEGTGALTIAAFGDALNVYPGGSITFWDNTSSLIIGSSTYRLVSDLATLGAGVNAHPSGFFALAKDYDASADGTYGDPPAGTLKGVFEGLGHTVSNFSLNTSNTSQVGMFAFIDGTARDVSMTGANVVCALNNHGGAGVLAGVNEGLLKNIAVAGTIACERGSGIGGMVGDNFGTMSNVTAAVTITGRNHNVGGLVAYSYGTIENASASGDVLSGGDRAGGLVGWVYSGVVRDSHASGHVSVPAGQTLGGFVGAMDGDNSTGNSLVQRCFATGNVDGGKMAGGLVGTGFFANIDSSFAIGNTTTSHDAGGLVGYFTSSLNISNSYARGGATVSGSERGGAAGLVGLISNLGGSATVVTSYSTGAPAGVNRPGGVAGQIKQVDSGDVADLYWDLDTSGISDPGKGAGSQKNYPGIAGLTTAQFQSGLPSGFNPAVWGQNPSINNGYPYLLANPPQ